jgi:RNA polymerase II subunit A small phosphatase-like protein
VERNYGNAVYVRPYYGETGDNELPQLAAYLKSLADTPNVRTIEKRAMRFS